MEFTAKDRELILKILKSQKDFESKYADKIKRLEDIVLLPVESPIKVNDVNPFLRKKRRSDTRRLPVRHQFDPALDGNEQNHIQLVFRDGSGDQTKQRILIESLYKTLKELCEKNHIEKLFVNIDDTII